MEGAIAAVAAIAACRGGCAVPTSVAALWPMFAMLGVFIAGIFVFLTYSSRRFDRRWGQRHDD